MSKEIKVEDWKPLIYESYGGTRFSVQTLANARRDDGRKFGDEVYVSKQDAEDGADRMVKVELTLEEMRLTLERKEAEREAKKAANALKSIGKRRDDAYLDRTVTRVSVTNPSLNTKPNETRRQHLERVLAAGGKLLKCDSSSFPYRLEFPGCDSFWNLTKVEYEYGLTIK